MADATPTPPKSPQPQAPATTAVVQAPAAPSEATPATAVPQQQQIVHTSASSYGEDGRLTLEGMRAAIAAGGSVLIHDRDKDGAIKGSKLHTSAGTLPTAADLAQTPEEKEKARKQLEDDRRRIDEQLKSLGK